MNSHQRRKVRRTRDWRDSITLKDWRDMSKPLRLTTQELFEAMYQSAHRGPTEEFYQDLALFGRARMRVEVDTLADPG